MTRSRLRQLGTASAALSLTFGAVAVAAPDRTAELSGSTAVYEWDAGPLTAFCAQADHTQVKLKEAGSLTTSLSNFSEPGPAPDLDIYLYKADAAGDPDGDELGSAESTDSEKETLTVRNLRPGGYVVEVCSYSGVATTFHGKVTFSGGTAVPGGTATPTPSPGASPTPGPGASDGTPDARANKPKRKPKSFSGTASDDNGVSRVEIALQTKKGKKCKQLLISGKFGAQAKCNAPTSWLRAKGTTKWSFKLKKKLKKGTYTLFARATDSAGQVQAGFTPANRRTFKVK